MTSRTLAENSHSFEYDEARVAFVAVQSKDPYCAMASWGESMSDFHGLWDEYNAPEGSKAAATARRIAAENPATTDREKQYIAAISEIFNEESIRSSQVPIKTRNTSPSCPRESKCQSSLSFTEERHDVRKRDWQGRRLDWQSR